MHNGQIDVVWVLIVVGPVLVYIIVNEFHYRKARRLHEAQRRRVMKSMGIEDETGE